MIHKRVITIAVFILFSTAGHFVYGDTPIIAGYLTPAPKEVLAAVTSEETPPPVVGGIKMTYSGYTNYTNNDGYFSFPKHHTADEIRLIVCKDTSYDLLKNTVSRIELSKKAAPPLAVYRITKQQEKDKTSTATSDDKTDAGSKKDAPSDNQLNYFFKIESQGTTLPAGGFVSSDVIIHTDPSYFYLQDQSVYYAEESTHFIIPNDAIFLLKTPPQTEISRDDNLSQSVDATITTDTVETQSTETDSMGNPLPGVTRATLQIN